MIDDDAIARAIHKARCGFSPCMIDYDMLESCEQTEYLHALEADARAVVDYLASLHPVPTALSAPPMVYIQLAENGNIRKWSRVPFEGSTPYRLADCKSDGSGLDDGPPLPRRTVQEWRDPAIKARHKAGASLRDIADEFGMSHEGVRSVVART